LRGHLATLLADLPLRDGSVEVGLWNHCY
jgi:hypothetical protein